MRAAAAAAACHFHVEVDPEAQGGQLDHAHERVEIGLGQFLLATKEHVVYVGELRQAVHVHVVGYLEQEPHEPIAARAMRELLDSELQELCTH